MCRQIFFEEQWFHRVDIHSFVNFPDYFKKGVGKNHFLFVSLKVSTITILFLEIVQKAGKKVDIHFFENIVFEKKFCKLAFW